MVKAGASKTPIRPRDFLLRMLLLFPAFLNISANLEVWVRHRIDRPAARLTVPLWDFGEAWNQFFWFTFPWWMPPLLLALSYTALYFIPKVKTLYFSVFLLGLISMPMFYSVNGAFLQVVYLSFAFPLFFMNADLKKIKALARFTLASIFIFGALHKINSQYMAGCEFLPGGDFYGGLHRNFADLAVPFARSQAFLISTIVLELLIGVATLFGSRVGLFAAAFFGPVISLIHPPAYGVLAFVSAFVFLCEPRLVVSAYRNLKSYGWLMVVAFAALVSRPYWAQTYASRTTILVTASFFANAFVLLLFFKTRRPWFSLEQPSKHWLNPWCLGLALFGVLPFFDLLPPPFGFSMFSGRACSAGAAHKFDLASPRACRLLQDRYHIFIWASKVTWTEKNEAFACRVTAPSGSTLELLKRDIESN